MILWSHNAFPRWHALPSMNSLFTDPELQIDLTEVEWSFNQAMTKCTADTPFLRV